MRILIAEDDFFNRTLLQKVMQDYGECELASDGQEAIEAFDQALVDKKPYELILLDIMMPKINGQEVLRHIRESERSRGISPLEGVKLLMTTALDDKRNTVDAYKHQADAYLVKPIELAAIREELDALGIKKTNSK